MPFKTLGALLVVLGGFFCALLENVHTPWRPFSRAVAFRFAYCNVISEFIA